MVPGSNVINIWLDHASACGGHADDPKAYPPPSPAAPISGGATPDEEPPPSPPAQSSSGSGTIPATFVDPIQNQPIASLAYPAQAPPQGAHRAESHLHLASVITCSNFVMAGKE